MIRIKATLATGEVYVGPIQGNGVGSGALHVSDEAGERDALQALARIQRLHLRGKTTGIFEPEPGCLAIYPNETTRPLTAPARRSASRFAGPNSRLRFLAYAPGRRRRQTTTGLAPGQCVLRGRTLVGAKSAKSRHRTHTASGSACATAAACISRLIRPSGPSSSSTSSSIAEIPNEN